MINKRVDIRYNIYLPHRSLRVHSACTNRSVTVQVGKQNVLGTVNVLGKNFLNVSSFTQ